MFYLEVDGRHVADLHWHGHALDDHVGVAAEVHGRLHEDHVLLLLPEHGRQTLTEHLRQETGHWGIHRKSGNIVGK